jgi:hypothetical protein
MREQRPLGGRVFDDVAGEYLLYVGAKRCHQCVEGRHAVKDKLTRPRRRREIGARQVGGTGDNSGGCGSVVSSGALARSVLTGLRRRGGLGQHRQSGGGHGQGYGVAE